MVLIILNFIISIVPAIFLCVYVYKKDVVEKEPLKLLLSLLFLGMLITVPAFFIENYLINTFSLFEKVPIKLFALSFLVIGFTEEILKYIITFSAIWKNKNFNYIYDGIVYATFTSLGFALFENILYVTKNGTQVGLMRAVISVPAHAFFSIISGYYLGLAKFNNYIGYKKYKNRFLFLSIFVPIFLHGLFDFMLFMGDEVILLVFYGFVVIMYIVSFLIIKKVSKTQMTSPME